MAAASLSALPLPSPTAALRNLRVAEGLRETAPAPSPEPLTRTEAYDLLAATSVGANAATLDFGDRKILGRFVTFSTPRRRAIKGGKGKTSPILIPTKEGGIEMLGEGPTWTAAWAATCKRVGAAT